MPKFDAREMMELAVQVMKTSVAEPRDDKASPLVGAVLVRSDGTVDTAARGELRHGDHAEFTLLERKNRATRLDGSVLFATLEPCAPGARSHPKLGCAERIVLARVAEVWVGIEDPDPKVDRRGIKFLQDNNILVRMFDADLQQEIRKVNAAFLDQAAQRATAAERAEPAREVRLSDFEQPPVEASLEELDADALQHYRNRIDPAGQLGEEEFERFLARQGLVQREAVPQSGSFGLLHDQQLVPTGFGILLFGRKPRERMPQAGLLATLHRPDGTEEVADFDEPAVEIPGQVVAWLRAKLPNPISRASAARTDRLSALTVLVREAVVNALVHRDYAIEGAKCQLVVTPDRIVVKSPGQPVPPITLEQLQSFAAPTLSRNPLMHHVFSKLGLAEERGLGLKSLRSASHEAGLPPPVYGFAAPYLTLTLPLTADAALDEAGPGLREELTEAEYDGWVWMLQQESFRSSDYGDALGLPDRTARNHLKRLQDLGLLQRIGAGRGTRYRVLR